MKNITLISLLLVLLTACAAPTSAPAAAVLPTDSPVPSVTFTTTDTPLPTLTPTPQPVELNTLAPETMGCLKNDMCLGLEVKDKEGAYQAVVEAFYREYENREWMQQMKISSLEQFQAFLRTSTHIDPATGEERTHWIPLTAPGGATFKILQGNGAVGGGATFSDKNPAIVEQGGFWLDTVGFVSASKAEIDTNKGGVADWLKKMWDQNGRKVLLRMGSRDEELFGITVVNRQLTFVSINGADPLDAFDGRVEYLLGHSDGKNDAKIASAQLQLCLEASVKYGNNRGSTDITSAIPKLQPDSTLWETGPYLCVSGNVCAGNIYGAPTWFVSQDTSVQ